MCVVVTDVAESALIVSVVGTPALVKGLLDITVIAVAVVKEAKVVVVGATVDVVEATVVVGVVVLVFVVRVLVEVVI